MSIVLSSDAKFTGFIEFTSPPQKAKMPYLVTQLYMNWKKKEFNSVKVDLEMGLAKLSRQARYTRHKGLFLLKKGCFLHLIILRHFGTLAGSITLLHVNLCVGRFLYMP